MPKLGLRVCPWAVGAEQNALCAEDADEIHERFIGKPLRVVLRSVCRAEGEGCIQQSRGIRKQFRDLVLAAPAAHMCQHQRHGADLTERVSRLFRCAAPAVGEANIKAGVRHDDQAKLARPL